jgi:peptidoglycan/LPS O-acetylase OafA/YrhL
VNVRADRFPLMDSLRAIAVLSVLVGHASFFISLQGTDFLSHWRFDFGVRAFFVVSGFLIYRPWVRARLRGEPSPLVRVYAWRRLLRILPGYWVALTGIAIWLGLTGVLTWGYGPLYYGFSQVYVWDRSGGGLVQAWSLCVEMTFYLFVPLWALAMRRLRATDPARRLRHELIGAGALFAFSLAFKVVAVQAGTLEHAHLSPLQLNLFTFLDDFAVGIALAALSVWYEERDDRPRALRVVDRHPWVPWLLAALAFYVVSFQIGLSGDLFQRFERLQYLERHYLYLAVAFGVVLPALFGDHTHGWVRRVLANRALLYVGLISYGVYLYQFAVLQQLERWGFADVASGRWAWLWLVVGIAASVALASLSYYAVERPILGLKRLVRQPAPSQAGEAIEEPAPVAPPRTQTS